MEEEGALRDLVGLRTRGSHSKFISHLSGSLEFPFGPLDRVTGCYIAVSSTFFPRKMQMEQIHSFLPRNI